MISSTDMHYNESMHSFNLNHDLSKENYFQLDYFHTTIRWFLNIQMKTCIIDIFVLQITNNQQQDDIHLKHGWMFQEA